MDVSDLFIIERGPNETSEVSREIALDEFIDNTDDAYGFPPFATLAPTLRVAGLGYDELRRRERALLDQALDVITVRRLSRDDFGWPAVINDLLARSGADIGTEPDLTTNGGPRWLRRRRPDVSAEIAAAYAGGQPA